MAELVDVQTQRILDQLPGLDGTTQLTLRDLPYLRMAMINISVHWYNIGIHFHIPTTVLDKFRSKNRYDTDGCLTCVVVEWLQNWNQKYGHPTWRKVVIAVASKVGGDNPAEAYRIGQQYKEYGTVNSFKDCDKVDNTPLDSQYLPLIVGQLMDGAATQWSSIGLFLGVPYKYIEISKMEDTLAEQVTKMVETWLQRKHDVKVFGEPSWRRLAEAVAARSGGGNLRLATEIAKSHPLNIGTPLPQVAVPVAATVPDAAGDVMYAQAQPPTEVLTVGDLAVLMNLLDSVAYKWDQLGIQLEVPYTDLKNIEANPMRMAGAPKTFLQDALYMWMQRGGDMCTILALCEALKSESVDEEVLAAQVEQRLRSRR